MRAPRLGFQAKVMIPVIVVMTLLSGITSWVLNERIAQQLHADAANALMTADAVFQNSREIRTKNLLLRYRSLPNEPRFKAVAQLGDPKTMRYLLDELMEETGGTLVQYSRHDKGQWLARASRDASLNLTEFERGSAPSVNLALDGQPNVDTVCVSGRLFEVISIPANVGNYVVGALTFAAEVGNAVAQEFRQLTHSEVVLLAGGQVAASTLATPQSHADLTRLSYEMQLGKPVGQNSVRQIQVDSEPFLVVTGRFPSLAGSRPPRYELLFPLGRQMHALQMMRQVFFGVALLGVCVASLIVWLVVRKITQPLRQLRDGVEAIGRGDFSRRAPVVSRDECGELASAFNRMTENLKFSHEQLEKTVANLQATKAQLTQSEKLSVIGEFVAGVAHELNNPLASVVGFAQLLQQSEVNPRQGHFLDRIARESQRCRKIVQNLLGFARQNQSERKRVDLNDLVHASAEILEYQFRTSNIAVALDLDKQLPAVLVDAHQIQQVFINILNNGRQAIEAHRSTGQITVVTRASGDHVCVLFRDNGPGISDDNLKKIFTPFFTTKEVGQGTGLGLSLCYGIIHEHGGSISVTSKLGEGATFTIELPVAAGTTDAPVQTNSATLVTAPGDGRGKRVLVVDDEEALRDLMSEILVGDSYDVDTASDGEAALRKTRSARYDLILCDWKMPGLNGIEFYEQLRTSDPQAAARFIFLTGDVVGAQKLVGQHGNLCLAKPFSLDELRSAVNNALN